MLLFAFEENFEYIYIFNTLFLFMDAIHKPFFLSFTFCLNNCTSGTSFTHIWYYPFQFLHSLNMNVTFSSWNLRLNSRK